MRRIFEAGLIGLAVIAVTGCDLIRTPATATDSPLRSKQDPAPVFDELCISWGENLPTRSRQDTVQTQDEIETAYAAFAAACPNHSDLIPE